jgi:signal transduction histidine kinase/CheY-like chemotaxis protein
MTEASGVQPITCTRAVAASLADGIVEVAGDLGSGSHLVTLGELEVRGSRESRAKSEYAARLLAGPGAAIAFLAEPVHDATPNGAAHYQVTLSLSAAALESAARHLLDAADGDVPHEGRQSLASLLDGVPFEDTTPSLAARLLVGGHSSIVRELEAARERDRTRVEVQAKLEQTERNRAYVALARGLGHHYNNRLAVIMARADLLARTEAGDTVATCADEISQACKSCTDFLVRFNSYASRMPINPVPRDKLDDVVLGALAAMQGFIEACSAVRGDPIRVHTDLACSSVVMMPKDDLQAGVEALVANAVEAMPEGGTLTIRSREDGGWATLEIEDTGVGMSASVASKVFNPFYTTKGPDRAGLSLSHVHSAVVQHGGSIDVQTDEGAGTTFHLRLPGASLSAQAMPHSVRKAGDGPVLVVEDEDDVRTALCDLLEAMGFDVIGARGGRQAQEAAEDHALGLVLTDLGVPDLSAFELARRLRATGVEAPIILLTGWVREVDSAAASDAGIDMVLTKPIAAEDLVTALKAFGVED